MLIISKIILIVFRLSIDFRVVYLVSRSDGETSGVCDSKCWTNEMHNAHYYFLYFNELLYYGSSLRSFKHANCKIELLLQIWKKISFQLLRKGSRGGFKHKMCSIFFNYH